MVVAFGIQIFAMQPPLPKPETAPANEFSAARAMALVEHLLGEGEPHLTGMDANGQVRDRIVEELKALGYPVEIQETFACSQIWPACGSIENIITQVPASNEGPAILLTAHYDSVGASPGAADNMAGVAVILEIARILSVEELQGNPITILLSDGEEPALLGAEAFVAEHPMAANVGVVVNLEARGTSGQSILFETTGSNSWLVEAFIKHAPRPVINSLYDVIYQYLPNNTDLTVYEAAGLPGINFAFFDEIAHYHTPLDNLDNLHPGSVQHQGDNALAAVRAFAGLDLTNPSTGNRVSIDLLPGLILHWPEPWTIWLAAAGMLVWAGLTITLIRRKEFSGKALLAGMVVLPLGTVGAALFGLVMVLMVSFLAGSAEPWYAHPWPVRIVLWAGALLIQLLAATAAARRAGFWAMSLGVWFWWAVLSLLLAGWLPGISVIFLVPTGLALLALVVVGFTHLRLYSIAGATAAVIALFVTASLWLPFALSAEPGAGLEIGAIVGIAVGLAASALAPLLAVPEEYRPLSRWLLAAVTLVIVTAVVVALRTPSYSEYRPQRLNLIHLEDRQTDTAYWLVEEISPPGLRPPELPAEFHRVGKFGNEPAPVMPWSTRQTYVAPAASASIPASDVQLLSDTAFGGERVVQIQLRSPRSANRVSLFLPEDAGLRQIAIQGSSFVIGEIPIENGYQTFDCFATECDGLTLSLYLESNKPFEMSIVHSSSGLPAGSESLIQARPAWAVPSHDGDVTLVSDVIRFDQSGDHGSR